MGDQPNPAWYYMQIGTAGNIDIDIAQTDGNGSGIDVDFALWGPANSLATVCNTTSNSAIDCSFSTSATETATITGAQVGDFYIMLITNYADVPGTITFAQTGGSGATDCAVLPVELISFYGNCNADFVQLEWSTATEINNAYFTIEKSLDAINYTPITTIDGHGNSNAFISYSYIDDNPSKQAYYRLKQTDFNGDYKYYPPISITCESSNDFKFYPNPFGSNIHVSMLKKGYYTIEIANYLGQIVFTEAMDNKTSQTIDLSNIGSQGIYFAILKDATGNIILSEKIFKQ